MSHIYVGSPLEQFEVVSIVPFMLGLSDFGLTNASLATFGVIFLIWFFSRTLFVWADVHGAMVPGRWQYVLEEKYKMISGMVEDNLGRNYGVYVPFIYTIFAFILFANLLGLIPYSFTVTSHIIVTLTMAMGIWVGKLYIGLRKHGWKLFGMFLPKGAPFILQPFLIVLEVISFILPLMSLPVRLFANMMAGHILLKVFAGFAFSMLMAGGIAYVAHFLPLIILFMLIGLELGVAVVQAYVFAMLTSMYLSDMESGGH
jgi:ATP synthase subunit 6